MRSQDRAIISALATEARSLLDEARMCVDTMDALEEWCPLTQADDGEWMNGATLLPGYQGLSRHAGGLTRDARCIVEALDASTRVYA